MVTAVVLNTPGDGNFTVPAGVILLQKVQVWGGGASGDVWESPISPTSGGGGAYADSINIVVTPGQVIPYHVAVKQPGANSGNPILVHAGDISWFGNSNPGLAIAYAQGGQLGGGGIPTGTGNHVTSNGTNGTVNTLDFGPGCGGGGAGGPNGAGVHGGTGGGPGPPGSGNGGNGDNNTGGAGGLDGASSGGITGQPGGNGTEVSLPGGGSIGSGGGGGGGSGINNGHGGNGGLYGGGGGTGTDFVFGGVGGDGQQGAIVVWFNPPAPFVSQGGILQFTNPHGVPTPPSRNHILLEDNTGAILLEDGINYIQMEH